jgi:hypothetical protein
MPSQTVLPICFFGASQRQSEPDLISSVHTPSLVAISNKKKGNDSIKLFRQQVIAMCLLHFNSPSASQYRRINLASSLASNSPFRSMRHEAVSVWPLPRVTVTVTHQLASRHLIKLDFHRSIVRHQIHLMAIPWGVTMFHFQDSTFAW